MNTGSLRSNERKESGGLRPSLRISSSFVFFSSLTPFLFSFLPDFFPLHHVNNLLFQRPLNPCFECSTKHSYEADTIQGFFLLTNVNVRPMYLSECGSSSALCPAAVRGRGYFNPTRSSLASLDSPYSLSNVVLVFVSPPGSPTEGAEPAPGRWRQWIHRVRPVRDRLHRLRGQPFVFRHVYF